MRFDESNLQAPILRAVAEMGFEEMSPIQAAAIPVVLEGRDIIGQAQTGTGKTAAFGIPLLQRVDPKDKSLQALVLCPTRELAIQVAEEVRKLAKFMHGVKVLPIYGGQDINKQIRSLKGGVQVIIGTPGRVMDHMRRHTLKMGTVKMITLDEADEMLNMGFREDIETILKELPEERQTLLFSATMPQPILELAETYQKDAEIVRVVKKELTVPKIEQFYYEVRQKNKPEVLARLLDMYDPKRALVFCNTKKLVDELVEDLQLRGYFADGLHGDLKQQQRDRVMESFRSGKIDLLVATDVAARGIDVDDVEAVFNYDVPQDDEYYVHRIGRTGRAGRVGTSHTLVVGKEIYKLKDIMRYCKTKIHLRPIPSADDINAIRSEKLMKQVDELIAGGELRAMTELVEKHIEETDCTALEMAAALLKLSMGEFATETAFDAGLDMSEGEGKAERARLFVNVGKRDRIRPGDIVGAIAGESGMPGQLVGSIQMYDNYTFVEVPVDYADAVLEAMQNVKIRGRNVQIERANGNGKSGGRSEGRGGNKSAGRSAKSGEGKGGRGKVKSEDRAENRGSKRRKENMDIVPESAGGQKKSAGKKRAQGKLGVVDVSRTGKPVRKKKKTTEE
ncbi:MAG: DEAD/DEAH box helicase [Lachnospiraceae bacterium]|nr:DEAD/DEAH box helicase [Lachnospiraceae bacterium]